MLAMIACMTTQGVIGKNGTLPWTCTDDMQRFKKLTMGDRILMGRKTAESLGKPLEGRKNYVVGRTHVEGFEPIHPLMLPSRINAFRDFPDVMWIAGGAALYEQTMHACAILHLTILHDDYDGDTYFPVELRDRYFIEKERHAFADGVFTTWYRKGPYALPQSGDLSR